MPEVSTEPCADQAGDLTFSKAPGNNLCRLFTSGLPNHRLLVACSRVPRYGSKSDSLSNRQEPMAEKKPNALQQPLQPSSELAAVVGSGKVTRGEVVSKIWDYIKKNNLQNPANKREILADAKLKPVFGGKDKVSMFEMNKHLAGHLKK